MKPSVSTSLPLHLRLRHNQFLHFERPAGLRLRAECGTLWVTVDGVRLDIQINAGQSRRFDGPAAITVGTLGGDAVLSAMAPAARPGRLQRWWQVLVRRPLLPSREAWR